MEHDARCRTYLKFRIVIFAEQLKETQYGLHDANLEGKFIPTGLRGEPRSAMSAGDE